MTRRREVSQPGIFLAQYPGEIIHADPAPSYLQHRTYQSTHHSTQKTIGFYPINKTLFLFPPLTLQDRTNKGLDLHVSLGKRSEILKFRDQGGSGLQFVPVEGIWKVIGPVSQKRVFL